MNLCKFSILEQGRALKIGMILLAFCLLVSCNSQSDTEEVIEGEPYVRPEVKQSLYRPENTTGTDNASLDTSAANEGYIGASAVADSRLKLKVEIAGDPGYYSYDMPQDGTPIIVPLNMGSGEYIFTIAQHKRNKQYYTVYSESVQVELSDDFEPYLRPTYFCMYTAESLCVQKAYELTETAPNEAAVLASIYTWVVNNITYDEAEAASVQSGYVPDPDEVLQTQKGICFDYSSLAAAMLRSQGIPCKIITGYVAPDDIYHAWNMVYINGTWVTVELRVDPNTWTRIDATFASGGAAELVGDGSIYTDDLTY